MRIIRKELIPRKEASSKNNSDNEKSEKKQIVENLPQAIKIADSNMISPCKKNKIDIRKEENATIIHYESAISKEKKKNVNYCVNLKELKPINL